MKGTIIIGFNEDSKAYIDKQFPSNVAEFLNISPPILKELSEHHLKKKMEPNYLEVKLEDDINVASFYSGFSFRHYVGTPNFAVVVFLSEDDFLPIDFEGMMRRISHELLPKREALNFDDILGRYYEMLKSEELTPYWEEIIEGETSLIEREIKKNKDVLDMDTEHEDVQIKTTVKDELENDKAMQDLASRNSELDDLLKEKKGKIRELTRKYTDLASENTLKKEEIDTLKNEISEQYIKLEKWSQQMAELNENNSKLLIEVNKLTEKLNEKEKKLTEYDEVITQLNNEALEIKNIEEEAEKILQEMEDLKSINLGLHSEIESLEKQNANLKEKSEKSKDSSNLHIDSITNLKLEIKNLKEQITSIDLFKEKVNGQTFDLKKEIKVLRRERDHYLQIVKDNNLIQ
ncbi:MAG: hypothetical protein ACTSP9_02540 [Promethearchaeota archaeon]